MYYGTEEEVDYFLYAFLQITGMSWCSAQVGIIALTVVGYTALASLWMKTTSPKVRGGAARHVHQLSNQSQSTWLRMRQLTTPKTTAKPSPTAVCLT